MGTQKIRVGSTWKGRGLRVQVLKADFTIAWVDRLDLPRNWPDCFRIHPWMIKAKKGPGDFEGMTNYVETEDG